MQRFLIVALEPILPHESTNQYDNYLIFIIRKTSSLFRYTFRGKYKHTTLTENLHRQV